jgi:hypothetical protein
MPEPILMKLEMYIMEIQPILNAYFINPNHQSMCLYVIPGYRGNEYISNSKRIIGRVTFCAVRVALKVSRRIVLTRENSF